jgi:hypothetical protein
MSVKAGQPQIACCGCLLGCLFLTPWLGQRQPGVIERDPDDTTVTRHLAAPLAIKDMIVLAPAGRELRAVQDASMFARFARRWVMTTGRRLSEPVVLEAKLCGIGILDRAGEVDASG